MNEQGLWPEGARLAVVTLVHLDAGLALGSESAPDEHYGHHAGFARLLRLLDRESLPVGWVISDGRMDVLPHIAHAIAARGEPVLAHAGPATMPEAEAIAQAALLLADRDEPRGWLGHPMRSEATAGLLQAHGFDHVFAASPLDQPFQLDLPQGALTILPVLDELSDLQMLNPACTPELWLQALLDSAGVLLEDAELTEAPRLLTLVLHLPVIARPSRIRALEQFLHFLDQQDGIWLATPADVLVHLRGGN